MQHGDRHSLSKEEAQIKRAPRGRLDLVHMYMYAAMQPTQTKFRWGVKSQWNRAHILLAGEKRSCDEGQRGLLETEDSGSDTDA